MDGLDNIVSVSITAESTAPSKPGFGTILIASYHSVTTDRVQEYADLTELVDAGFSTSSPTYKCASKIFAQNPRVSKIKVGRRANPYTQTVELTLANSSTEGVSYSLKVNGTTCTGTIGSTEDQDDAAEDLASAIDALANVTATASGAVVTVTTAAGLLSDFSARTKNISFEDVTEDPDLQEDLAAIAEEDSDWYGLVLDSNSAEEIAEAAEWTEANGKFFAANSTDSACADANSTDDIISAIKASGYERTIVLYSKSQSLSYSGAALMGDRFPDPPGSDTWNLKGLSSVTADKLSGAEKSAVLGKNGTTYTNVSGTNVTEGGKTGSGKFADQTRFVDWLQAEIKVRLFAKLSNVRKVPYTDVGVDIVKNIIAGALADGVSVGGLAATPAPTVTAPRVKDVNFVDRANRLLPDVKFEAVFAGAIHKVTIMGTVSV